MNQAILDLQQIAKPSTKTMHVGHNRKCTYVNSKPNKRIHMAPCETKWTPNNIIIYIKGTC